MPDGEIDLPLFLLTTMATISKKKVIADLRQYAPAIEGVCPNCGHLLFHGYKCLNCYYDKTENSNIEKYGKPIPFDIDNIE